MELYAVVFTILFLCAAVGDILFYIQNAKLEGKSAENVRRINELEKQIDDERNEHQRQLEKKDEEIDKYREEHEDLVVQIEEFGGTVGRKNTIKFPQNSGGQSPQASAPPDWRS